MRRSDALQVSLTRASDRFPKIGTSPVAIRNDRFTSTPDRYWRSSLVRFRSVATAL
jgi:hypothetical protein